MSSVRLCNIVAGLSVGATMVFSTGPTAAAVLVGAQQAETSVIEDGDISPFNWNFSALAAGTGLASLQVNFARLDLNAGESLAVLVDGNLLGTIGNAQTTSCVDGIDRTFGPNFRFFSDCDGSATFSFATSILNDGNLQVTVQNNLFVTSLIDDGDGAGWASISVSYQEASAVPEPASLALCALALAAAAGLVRRRKA